MIRKPPPKMLCDSLSTAFFPTSGGLSRRECGRQADNQAIRDGSRWKLAHLPTQPLATRHARGETGGGCTAHEAGLGTGRIEEIDIVAKNIGGDDFGFTGTANTSTSRGQKLIYQGPLKPLEKILLRTVIAPWSYIASRPYHDAYWYPFVDRRRVAQVLATLWGKFFKSYPKQHV